MKRISIGALMVFCIVGGLVFGYFGLWSLPLGKPGLDGGGSRNNELKRIRRVEDYISDPRYRAAFQHTPEDYMPLCTREALGVRLHNGDGGAALLHEDMVSCADAWWRKVVQIQLCDIELSIVVKEARQVQSDDEYLAECTASFDIVGHDEESEIQNDPNPTPEGRDGP